jgi:predicted ATPase
MALFQSIRLKNFLSFGPKGVTLPLKPLNVLIGPNGSGKSNLIEAFRVLQSAPTDLTGAFRGTGPIEDGFGKATGTVAKFPRLN